MQQNIKTLIFFRMTSIFMLKSDNVQIKITNL